MNAQRENQDGEYATINKAMQRREICPAGYIALAKRLGKHGTLSRPWNCCAQLLKYAEIIAVI